MAQAKPSKPFLFRQARMLLAQDGEPTRYNERTDELMLLVDGSWIPAIDSLQGPRTKKADLETGEDQKDRW